MYFLVILHSTSLIYITKANNQWNCNSIPSTYVYSLSRYSYPLLVTSLLYGLHLKKTLSKYLIGTEQAEINLMFIGPCIIAIVDEWKTNLMSLAILFHLLCAQHVSDINISIFRSLWLCWWITTLVVLFSVRCVLELLVRAVFGGVRFAGWNTASPPNISRNKSSNTQRTENKTTDVVIQQHSRKLLKMDILMSETCWAHNKWNKIACDIKLVFHSSTIAMMHSPINIR